MDSENLNTVKVGPKGRHITIPDGWHIITDVPMEAGDKCALIYEAKWTPIDEEDIGLLPWQDCVIRKNKI